MRRTPDKIFTLSPIQWALFVALIDAPPRATAALQALLTRTPCDAERPPPVALRRFAKVRHFDCGVDSLDEALKRDRRATSSVTDPLGRRSFAVTHRRRVIGYYSQRVAFIECAAGDRAGEDCTVAEPAAAMPVVVLARLAVDRAWHGRGLGTDLLADALRRGVSRCEQVGARAFYVHALTLDVMRFYLQRGFHPLPAIVDPLGAFVTPEEARSNCSVSREFG